MKKEQAFLLSVLATAVDPAREKPDPKALSAAEWNRMIGESLLQAVGYLTFSLCEPLRDRVPSEIYQNWNCAAIKILGRNRNVATAQTELVSLLDDRPYLILKGMASAAYYPNPALRDFGDVDFLVDEELQREVSDLLLSHEYRIIEERKHHTAFKKPFYHLEMHREPPGIPEGAAGEKIRAYLGPLQQTAKLQTLDSDYLRTTFRAPDPARHGLILLLHMQHHMTGDGLGLRHLLDWGFFVAETWREPFWQAELLPLLEQVGLARYAKVMTGTCARYLGFPEPDFCRDVPNDLCADVIEDIFALGNFGMKDRGRSHSTALAKTDEKSGRRKGVFGVFHEIVMGKYPVLHRAPVLYPFLAVGETFCYGFGVLTGKRTRLSKLLRSEKERKKLYDRLQDFQIEDPRPDAPADRIS